MLRWGKRGGMLQWAYNATMQTLEKKILGIHRKNQFIDIVILKFFSWDFSLRILAISQIRKSTTATNIVVGSFEIY